MARNSARPERTTDIDYDYRSKMSVRNLDPSFQHRWVNDTPGRIYEMMELGYELVPDRLRTEQAAADGTAQSQLGSAVQRQVGGGTIAYLMRIPKELYDKIQEAKLADVRAIEEALKGPAVEGQYGNVTIS